MMNYKTPRQDIVMYDEESIIHTSGLDTNEGLNTNPGISETPGEWGTIND